MSGHSCIKNCTDVCIDVVLADRNVDKASLYVYVGFVSYGMTFCISSSMQNEALP